MKKLLILILLLSCNRIMKNLNFKCKNIDDDLVLAIKANNTNKIIELIKQGANINYIQNKKSILDLSLDNKNLEIVKELLRKGVKINNNNIIKIYDLALEDFNYEIVDLIKDGYNLEEGSIDNNKYFLLLCYLSNANEVENFIEKKSFDPKEIKDKINRNALMISTIGNKIGIFEVLIEKYSFNINYKNSNEGTVLMTASQEGHKEIVKILLGKGANVNEKDKNGSTALMIASLNGHFEVVKLLLEKGANVNDKNNNGRTALMYASFEGYKEILEILIERGANINDKNNNGRTALMYASLEGHKEVVKLLLEKGANINDKNNNGRTALIYASFDHKEIVEILIERGANINDKNNNGWTALMIASQEGHKEIVKILLEKGANVNDKNNDYRTPLMSASQEGHKEVVEILLEIVMVTML